MRKIALIDTYIILHIYCIFQLSRTNVVYSVNWGDELGWKKNVYKLYMYFYLCCANLQWVHGYIRTNKLYFLLYCIPYTIVNLPV